ncbi:hypothetical protein [Nonomuraea sp. B5E05]|uniref:hypothetical protein n=1 Tax=Nonomuraea sp. B5E05 TaxID=3153569 RepID=UPI003261C431
MGYPPGGQQPPPPGHHQPPQPWPGPRQAPRGAPYQRPPAAPPRGRGPVRIVFGVLIAGFGVLCTLAGGGVIAQAFSNSNQEIYNQEYTKNLWRNLPAETLFPPAIGMRDPDRRDKPRGGWTRVAISPETSCGKALAGGLAEEAKGRGCQTALRATYVDATGGTAATVAIVVFPADDSGNDLDAILYEAQREERDYGVRALPAKGVKWTDGARAGSGADSVATLFVAVTSGPADGRRAGRLPQPWGRRESDQRIDRSPWGEISTGLAESTTAHLRDQIQEARP